MSARTAAVCFNLARRNARRTVWLTGISAAALFIAAPDAYARPLGGHTPSSSQAAIAAAQSGAQEAARQAQNALKRATLAIQSIQATQAAAREAAKAALVAMPSGIPHGLKPGGLQVAPGAMPGSELWQGANLPTEFTDADRTRVTVEQKQQKAILTWQTFNVSERTDLYFDQRAGGANAKDWIALNRVLDPSTAPSKILGSIKAEGQVYLINRNGIIFGGTSQVNVGTLIASSLALSNEQFIAGINNPQRIERTGGSHYGIPQFGEHATAGGPGEPFTPDYVPGDVRVESGALVQTSGGGKVMLFAPKVTNAGQIEAVDGQVILAAGEQVWLGTDLGGVRGLDVAVSAPAPRLFSNDDLAGGAPYLTEMEARAAAVGYNVTNTGSVHAERGNITLQSREINQNGVLTATSALNNREGSIRLRAWGQGMMVYSSSFDIPHTADWSTGTLTLGSDSVTAVMPDLSDTSEIELAALATRYKPGRIEMRGELINVEARANVIVPAGTISIVASTSPLSGEEPVAGEPVVRDGSRVYIGEDAYLSVAGLQDVLVAMERNFIEGEFRINELRDSPLYRDSWLRGVKVVVDRRVSGTFEDGPMAGVEWLAGEPGKWIGTPLGDFSGWIGVGKTDLGELSTKAGSILIKSSGSVITRTGSLLDVSGGSVRYSDGWNTATKLLGADGRVYDIGNASSDMIYVGLAQGFRREHARWGITETWTNPLGRTSRRYERGYVEGRDAGAIRVFAGEAMVLEGGYWGGVIVGERQASLGNLPKTGTLTLGDGTDPARNFLPGEIIVARNPVLLGADFTATSELDPLWYDANDIAPHRAKTTYLDSDVLAEAGMGEFNWYVAKGFTQASGEELELAPGTNFFVSHNVGANSSAAFQIDGTIRIAGGNVLLLGTTNTFGVGAKIDVSGEWVNDLTDTVLRTAPAINGGTIRTGGMFAPGAVLDVSGGGWLKARGGPAEVELGDGGSISLADIAASQLSNVDLRGYAAGSGGQLSIATMSFAGVQVGGATPTDSSVFHISETLFGERGFRSLSIDTGGDIVVPDSTIVSQLPVSLVLGRDASSHASGAKITDLGALGILPPIQRAAHKPSGLSLSGGSITVGAGAMLRTDIGGTIGLGSKGGSVSSGDLVVRGTVEAPAGGISLSADNGKVVLASGAALLARGVPVIDVDGRGLRYGTVRDGGSVNISSLDVALEFGSLIDVSGASGTIDIPAGGLLHGKSSLRLDSNGGSIALSMGGGLIEGTLLARAGGERGIGGIISIAGIGGGGGGPAEALQNDLNFPLYDPDCNGFVADGVCNNNWRDLVGFDLGRIMEYYGVPVSGPMIVSQAMIDAGTGGNIIVSNSATGSGGADPLAFGWTDQTLDEVRDLAGVDIRTIFAPYKNVASVVVRPASLANSGAADLSLESRGKVQLDGVNLAAGRSIAINAALTNGNGANSTIRAPYISLFGGSANSAFSTGTLSFTASLVDISGIYIRGFAETVFETSDLRLTSPLQGAQESMLDVSGVLTLRVGQVYPTSNVAATIRSSERITVERLGDVGAPLSAGGSLTLEAPVIAQNGVLRAPFGQITLKASERLVLGDGSVTSVSGAGLFVPYGALSNGEYWLDPAKLIDQDPTTAYLAMPPEKRIVFDAPVVDSATGSRIDIRGGGDLYAREFVPGPGGSHDVLGMPGTFAVLPGYAGFSPSGPGLGVGDRVWLGGGNGLAAGWYTLLPASYAALPGAYAVSLAADGLTTPLSKSIKLADGSVMMGGYRGNGLNGAQDQLSSSWRVMSGAQLRQYTEYNEAFANSFFASDAFKLTQYRLTGQEVVTPRLPMDGGAVVFKATQELVLDGQLQSQAAQGGRGGLVDIAAAKIAIVGAGQDASALQADGYLVLDSASLTSFGAGSLLVGGTHRGDPLGLRIDVTASDIVVRNNEASALSGPEIILAASGLVDIGACSVIAAEGEAATGTGDLILTPQIKAIYGDRPGQEDSDPANDILLSPSKDYGALIRISNGDAVRVIRENVDTTIGGIVTTGADVRLAGGKALLIDATGNTELSGTAVLSGSALTVASGRISFGGGSEGLVLSLETLTQLNRAYDLTLRSYSSIDFHASVDFGGAGLSAVTFDAAGLAGYGAGTITVSAATIALENSRGGNAGAGTGTGTLVLGANELILGSGTKRISGFDAVTLAGATRIVGDGDGSIDAGGATLTLATPVLTGRGGAVQSVVTGGALTIIGDTTAALTGPESSLGTRLSLSGGSVAVHGRIVALGGAVEVTASSGDLMAGAGALIDVGGFAKQFFDVADYADAGQINLSATGNVQLAAGSVLNLAAHAGGGDAGRLSVTSNGGTVALDGSMAAQAGAGGKAGSFALDIATLPEFGTLSERLNNAGFFAARQFRIRQGHVLIDGTTTVADFSLAADQGMVTLVGTIDARSAYGGKIAISGGDGVVMESSATLLAAATDTTLGSGRVTLEASGGTLDLRGGTIDVAGGEGGKVRLRALQTAAHDEIAETRLDTHIVGARSAVLEGVSVYDSNSVDAVKPQAIADANTFASHAGIIATRLANDDVTLMPGIEIRSSGDLAIETDWNLFADFGSTMREGGLTLRAAGNLIIRGHISDGFDLADRSGVLQDTASWNLRLVAGADLTSANALAVTPLASLAADSGNLIVGDAIAGKLIRTGTGDIDVRVGRNLDLAHMQSVIYTAGRKDTTNWGDFTAADATATYGINGGHLSITAQGSISSALSTDPDAGQLFTEWLKRRGDTDEAHLFRPYFWSSPMPGEQSTWWVNYGAFEQGVGALGGGNVSIDAGGDLVNLVVALPTNGRVRGGRSPDEQKILEMRNGGLMAVHADGAIRAGQYYVGRGAGTINAGELANGRTVTYSQGGVVVATYPVAPVLALGDATLSVRTAGDLRLQTVVDPLMLKQSDDDFRGYFMSGFTERSALDLTSVGGDVILVNQSQYFWKNDIDPYRSSILGDLERTKFDPNLYPAMTRIAALNGSVENLGEIITMPGRFSELRVLADQNISLGSILMSRATLEMLPSPFEPYGDLTGVITYPSRRIRDILFNGDLVAAYANAPGHYGALVELGNPEHLTNESDYEPSRFYARTGSIIASSVPYTLDGGGWNTVTTNEQTWFRAGTDVRSIFGFQLRNIHSTDVTLIEAGNDITSFSSDSPHHSADIQGPGALVLSAGRDVYGRSFELYSLGSGKYDGNNRPILGSEIRGLPDDGAAITVMAGLKGKQPSYDAFMAAYLDPANVAAMPDYLKTTLPDGTVVPLYFTDLAEALDSGMKPVRRGLVSFVEEMTGETLLPFDAWARFRSLPKLTQEVFLCRIYMQELRDAGRNQNEPGENGLPANGGYNRGYAAIETLFPGDDWRGDVVAQSLALRTMAGGDLEVLTPGGGLQVAALGATVPPGAGLITLGSGHINIFARDNVTVNRSRILTFVPEATARGSDLIIWSTLGDIDAGRGAKTLRVPSAPDILTDLDGNTRILERTDVSGSGIGTVGDGDLDLIAPRGTVNFGDAGVRVAADFNVAALHVLNADNIQIGGEAKGLPPAPKSTLTPLTLEADSSQKAVADAAKDATQSGSSQPISIIIVELLGFGGGDGSNNPETNDERERQHRSDSKNQDPKNPVQILDAGELTADKRRELIEERRQLVGR